MDTLSEYTEQHPEIDVKVKFLEGPEGPYRSPDGELVFDYSTTEAAGIDLRACFQEKRVTLAPGERYPVPSGIAIEIGAPGVAGFVYSRSGLGAKHGLTVSQGVGVIDPDYRGEIIVSLLNTSGQERSIERGDRIAQLLFMPFFRARFQAVEELGHTRRGAGGFGHTGTK